MDKEKLEAMLKDVPEEKLKELKENLNANNLDGLLNNIDIKKASSALSALNINPYKLGSIISSVKNNPEILKELKEKLK